MSLFDSILYKNYLTEDNLDDNQQDDDTQNQQQQTQTDDNVNADNQGDNNDDEYSMETNDDQNNPDETGNADDDTQNNEENTGEDDEYSMNDPETDDTENQDNEENTEDGQNDDEYSMGDPEGDNTDDQGTEDDTPTGTDENDPNTKLKDLEKSIFDQLSPEQQQIKTKELKNLYDITYQKCQIIIDMISDSEKDPSKAKVYDYVLNSLVDLQKYIKDYLSNIFDSKTYIENMTELQKYLAVLDTVNNVFEEIQKESSSKDE